MLRRIQSYGDLRVPLATAWRMDCGGVGTASGRPLGKQYSEQGDCDVELEGENVGETRRRGQRGQPQEVAPFADGSAFGGKGSVSYKGDSWI